MPKFYGYKRCSTSRKAQKWFDDKGISYDFQDLHFTRIGDCPGTGAPRG